MAEGDQIETIGRGGKIGCVAILLAGVLFMAYIWPSDERREEMQAEREQEQSDEFQKELLSAVVKEAFGSDLGNLDNANFRNIAPYSGGPEQVICGEMSANNIWLSGFERFIASATGGDFAVHAADPPEGQTMDQLWDTHCISAEGDPDPIR